MKRIFVTVLLMLCLGSINTFAADKKAVKARIENMSEEQKEARFIQMKQRVEEIRNMDKSLLSKEERTELRNELKDLKQEAKAIGHGGVYISFAGIIIIILLLIILL